MLDGITMGDLRERVVTCGGNSLVSAHHVELEEPGNDLVAERYVEPEELGNHLLAEHCVELKESGNNLVAEHCVELGEPGDDLWELSWRNRVRSFSGLL